MNFLRHSGVLVTFGLLFGAFLPSAQGDISFTFDYSGSSEFDNSSSIGQDRRDALEEAAATFGSWFGEVATISIAVYSKNTNDGTLATAKSAFPLTGSPGFGNRGITSSKILGLGDANGPSADGTVTVNFFYDYSLSGSATNTEYDFQSIIIHELMHTVGFSSQIREDGKDLANQSPGATGYWTPFDEFVGDNAGVMIDGSSYILDGTRWNSASVGGVADGLFFYGTNVVAANGGNPVNMYSPGTWDNGSSGSHLDSDFFTGDNLLMEHNIGTGPGTQELSSLEIGILKDLGYNIVVVPEPSAGLYGLLVAGCLLLRRRRIG